MNLDPRLTLARTDLASSALEGLVPAARYARPTPRQCALPAAAIRKTPAPGAEQVDELLFGEAFEVLEDHGGFAFGQAVRDGYVGYVDLGTLSSPVLTPTHRITALRTYAFAEPGIKTPPRGLYSLNALVTVEAREGRFCKIARSGWMVAEHLQPVGEGFGSDPARIAEMFLSAPYLWGGRTSLGLDCSGLVQQALYACGRACPRDSDQQQALGSPLEIAAGLGGLQRNDLAFWRGHVGIMLDSDRLLHANAHHMAVASEPLAEALTRIEAAGGGPPTAFRRL